MHSERRGREEHGLKLEVRRSGPELPALPLDSNCPSQPRPPFPRFTVEDGNAGRAPAGQGTDARKVPGQGPPWRSVPNRSNNSGNTLRVLSLIFATAALLRYNSHKLGPRFKYTIQWVLIHSELGNNHHLYLVPEHPITPLADVPQSPPQPLTTLIHSLFLWICQFWTFVNRITICDLLPRVLFFKAKEKNQSSIVLNNILQLTKDGAVNIH